MTSVATSPQSISRPHVKVERSRVTSSTRENSRSTNTVSSPPKSPTTPAQKPVLATNRRFSSVQSKVGSLEAINYKPKPSDKKIPTFKQDLSHVKSKVDAKLVLPAPVDSADSEDAASAVPVSNSPPTSPTARTTRATTAPAKRPTVITTGSRVSSTTGTGVKPLSPTSRSSSTVSSIRTAGTRSTGITSAVSNGTNTSTPLSPTHSRRASTSSATSSPAGPTRRLSKHIIPTQNVQYDNVKSKVGSFDNISYASRGRASSRTSSADEGNGGAISPSNGRSRSPSAMSSTSSTGPSSPARRSSFKIPSSKKVDYSKVRSKVGSLENATHTPQGGNLRIFSEKLTFRDQAQSKIAKEINISQFYDYSFENSIQEEQEGEGEEGGQLDEGNDRSIIYSSEADADEFEPPKNILSILDEMIESVGELDLEEQEQHQQQQANDSHDAHMESVAAM
ncbi:hypothetical protein BGX27_006678 [Mortierella sp. AM989]|nr:hypothetical protein BGX27_006678 [Mortierella sp. AM989]